MFFFISLRLIYICFYGVRGCLGYIDLRPRRADAWKLFRYPRIHPIALLWRFKVEKWKLKLAALGVRRFIMKHWLLIKFFKLTRFTCMSVFLINTDFIKFVIAFLHYASLFEISIRFMTNYTYHHWTEIQRVQLKCETTNSLLFCWLKFIHEKK